MSTVFLIDINVIRSVDILLSLGIEAEGHPEDLLSLSLWRQDVTLFLS